jgi:hypothetical protein
MSSKAPNSLPKPDPVPQSGGHPFTKALLRDLSLDIAFGGAMVAFGVIAFVAVFVAVGGLR